MNAPGWRTSLIVQGHDPVHGRDVPVVVGLVETATDGPRLVLRIGERGMPVTLPLQVASQLMANLGAVLAERLKVTAEKLGDDR